MTFLDLFAGVGGFRRGMELARHKCIGFCEWDKFARMSYISMHCITEDQRKYLATLDMKNRQKEILKDEYLNGEWCSTDIRSVNAGNIPKADCWCFGAPCQDFSLAGERKGLDGDRSSLIREVFRILGELEEEDKPEWLIYENVKGMLSSNRGFDYLSILCELDRGGYDTEWQVFNSKDYGVPQNRERVYTVGHFRKRGIRKIFPVEATNGENPVRIAQIGYDGSRERRNPDTFRVYDVGGGKPDTDNNGAWKLRTSYSDYFRGGAVTGIDKSDNGKQRTIANALTAREDRGISKQRQTGTAVAYMWEKRWAELLLKQTARRAANGQESLA